MDSGRVEAVAPHLSALLKNRIHRVLPLGAPAVYSHGEALLLWTADWLTQTKLLRHDQLQLVVEEFAVDFQRFGAQINDAMTLDQALVPSKLKPELLPVCKLGFLDRQLACIDGNSTFINLSTGDRVPTTQYMPLETIVYNLTTLFVRYYRQMKSLNPNESNSWPRRKESAAD